MPGYKHKTISAREFFFFFDMVESTNLSRKRPYQLWSTFYRRPCNQPCNCKCKIRLYSGNRRWRHRCWETPCIRRHLSLTNLPTSLVKQQTIRNLTKVHYWLFIKRRYKESQWTRKYEGNLPRALIDANFNKSCSPLRYLC